MIAPCDHFGRHKRSRCDVEGFNSFVEQDHGIRGCDPSAEVRFSKLDLSFECSIPNDRSTSARVSLAESKIEKFRRSLFEQLRIDRVTKPPLSFQGDWQVVVDGLVDVFGKF